MHFNFIIYLDTLSLSNFSSFICPAENGFETECETKEKIIKVLVERERERQKIKENERDRNKRTPIHISIVSLWTSSFCLLIILLLVLEMK